MKSEILKVACITMDANKKSCFFDGRLTLPVHFVVDLLLETSCFSFRLVFMLLRRRLCWKFD